MTDSQRVNIWAWYMGRFGFLTIMVIFLIEALLEILAKPALGFPHLMTVFFSIVTTAFFSGSRTYYGQWISILSPWMTVAFLFLVKYLPQLEIPVIFIGCPLIAGVLLYIGLSKPE